MTPRTFFGAQGLSRQHRAQRRIDAAGEPDDHALEPGLEHFITNERDQYLAQQSGVSRDLIHAKFSADSS